MKVRVDISPDATMTVIEDGDGNPIAIEFEPLFVGRNSQVTLAYVQVNSDHKAILDRFSLVVSGKTGTITKKSRLITAKAFVDLEDSEKAQSAPKEDEEEGEE